MSAVEPDPIFAAIEAHRSAYSSYTQCVTNELALEEELPADKRRSSFTAWKRVIVESDDPRWIAAERGTMEGIEAADRAAISLPKLSRRPLSALLPF
jgi:hypothetical protein